MEREQVLYEDGEYRVPSQGDIILNQAIEDFTKAIANQDFFEAVKKLGVIELFKTPDLPFFTGMAFQTDKQFQKSVEYYLQVPEKSIFYSSAMLGLARSYEVTGQYILLDELLKKRCFEISPIKELFSRQNCIEHMGIDDFINEYENLSQITAPQVDKMPQDPEEQEINYHIFRVFADMLVVAGECINQCVIYKKNVKDSGFDFDNYPETALFAKMYKKCVYILEYSKYVGYIQFSGSIESFAICALSDKIWEEKLKIFTGTNYIQQIAQIIFDICKPERYPSVPPFVCLAGIMERYQHMAPTLVDGIIGAYFDIVSNAALAGDKTAWDYMGLSYSRILVTSEDPYMHERRHAALEHRVEEHRADEGDRDVPGNHLADEQVDGADQEREGGDFSDAAVHVADEEVLDERGLRPVKALRAFLDEREGRGGGDGLCAAGAKRPGRRAPGRHRAREGDEHERACAEGGVEGVVAESAEHLLRDTDREHAADGGHPDRQVGREVEREQETGDDGGEVADRVVALHCGAAEPFGDEAGRDARACEDERADAEEVHAAAECRQKGDDHVQHEPARGRRSVCVRRAGKEVVR